MKNVLSALLNVQKGITALKKDAKGFNYDYLSGDKLLSKIRPLLDENGLILAPEILSVRSEMYEYQQEKKGKIVNVKEILYHLTMKMTFFHADSGESLESNWYACGMNDFEKGYGSALTYAERYFLMKFFHIATDKDDIDYPDRKTDMKSYYSSDIPKEEDKAKKIPTMNPFGLGEKSSSPKKDSEPEKKVKTNEERIEQMINAYLNADENEKPNVKAMIFKTFMKDSSFEQDQIQRVLDVVNA